MRRGDGRIYERKSSVFLWCQYYLRGKQYRESTGETSHEKAEKYLKRRLREVGADLIGAKSFVGPQQERVKLSCGRVQWNDTPVDGKQCDCLCCALYEDYRLRGKNSPQFAAHLKHVSTTFSGWRAAELTSERMDRYISERLENGAAPATVNRSTQLLTQAYKLAIDRRRISTAPTIRHLSEKGNERKGFFGDIEFRTVVEHLPEYLRDFARFAYLTGMGKGEIASLRWEDIDGDVIRLRAENAKNGEGRSVPIEGDVADLIDRRRNARQVKRENRPTVLAAWIFHRDGEPVGDFRKAWATACVMAGLGRLVCPKCECIVDADYKCARCPHEWDREELKYLGKLFHDFRRTAVRDMVRAGVPETVAMSISGHKTRSMFDRYNIHDERDQRQALRATQNYRSQQAAIEREKIASMPRQSTGIN